MNMTQTQNEATHIDKLLELMRRRRSCRLYTREPVSEEMLANIVEAGRWAPSGCNSEPWELIVVTDPAVLQLHADRNQSRRAVSAEREIGPDGFPFSEDMYLYDLQAIIVVCGDRRLAQTYPELYYKWDMYVQSIGACIQNMFLAAAAQGLGGTWLSMGRKLEPPMLELFGVPEGYRVETILAIGWPGAEREPRHRRATEEILHHNKFDASRAQTDDDVKRLAAGLRHQYREDSARWGELRTSHGDGHDGPPADTA
jgi:nitroreductase